MNEEEIESLAKRISQQLNSCQDDCSSELRRLQVLFNRFCEPSPDFKPGDIVRWKTGLKNRKFPHDGQMCIVLDVLKEPVINNTAEPGSPFYREPLDLILAVLVEGENNFTLYHYDKRRFELVR
jgi:hypothetical protein